MPLSSFYAPGRLGLSFELFPPKTPAGEAELFAQLGELMAFRPDFVTCTYGAGGSTRDKTLDICSEVKGQYGCEVAAHLTCVGSTADDLRRYLAAARSRGIDSIVALRGDPPRGETSFRPVEGGFRYAGELVRLIHGEFPSFGIAVAGYPETHREATSAEADLEALKWKVEGGADAIVTQLFYDNADFFAFRQRCADRGIRAPIIPGLLPITNYAQVRRITELCGSRLPQGLVSELEACGDDAVAQFDVGVDHATRQTEELLAAGVPGIHFYVLNKSLATCCVLDSVLPPRGQTAAP